MNGVAELLAAHEIACAEDKRARRLMAEAECRFDRLRKKWRKRLGKRAAEERAYFLAGVSLADRRALKTYARVTSLRAHIMARPEIIAAIRTVMVDRNLD